MSWLAANPPRRILAAAVAILLCAALYLTNLSAMGLVSVDEPRYAAIGRAMAESGDWVTPRLWGEPWFEKPVLLYWLVGLGFKAGLGPELAPRLPIALVSVGFLIFFWFRLRQMWDEEVANYSTGILATSVGWLAYSRVAITDVPMVAAFATAVLLTLDPIPSARRTSWAAAVLGIAVLGKSLIAGVLFLPVLALNGRWRQWLRPAPILAFLAVALPWHILCFLANGRRFTDVLFLEHQLGRFSSGALQHVQPFWYYLPVLLMLTFPWFPLLALVPRDLREPKLRTLWALFGWGFLFLSMTVNKLPHYLLPVLPVLSILIGMGIAKEPRARLWMAPSVALLGLLPLAAKVAPIALADGLRDTPIPWLSALWLPVALAAGLTGSRLGRWALPAALAMAALAFLSFEQIVLPAVDASSSMRTLWKAQRPTCAPQSRRDVIYGLSYYANRSVPACSSLDP